VTTLLAHAGGGYNNSGGYGGGYGGGGYGQSGMYSDPTMIPMQPGGGY
jgi:hypothetical protein